MKEMVGRTEEEEKMENGGKFYLLFTDMGGFNLMSSILSLMPFVVIITIFISQMVPASS